MRLVDVSDKGSPVHISGQVLFKDDDTKISRYSYQVKASATNVSNKRILLMVIRFEANGGTGPGYDSISRRDYFFFPNVVQPGAVENVDQAPISFDDPVVDGSPAVENATQSRPAATARVEFIEFDDGSIWGDAETATSEFEHRQRTIRQLGVLEHFYNYSGEQAFLDELSKQTDLGWISELRDDCKSKNNYFTCAHDEVLRLLEKAKQHEISGAHYPPRS
jgi:hypothetical protein